MGGKRKKGSKGENARTGKKKGRKRKEREGGEGKRRRQTEDGGRSDLCQCNGFLLESPRSEWYPDTITAPFTFCFSNNLKKYQKKKKNEVSYYF